MQLIQRNKDSAYLQYDKYVDYDNPIVAAKAKELAEGCKSSDEIIQACYYFVRDEISHTYDSNFTIITISASDVLKARTGISYSKANLLAALLRANNFYTGFCYIRIKHKGGKLAMHALNAVYHPDLKKMDQA